MVAVHNTRVPTQSWNIHLFSLFGKLRKNKTVWKFLFPASLCIEKIKINFLKNNAFLQGLICFIHICQITTQAFIFESQQLQTKTVI